jgi:putative selenate reductase
VTDPQTRGTATDRVYAGGDVTRGPAIIIQACEDGRRAAEAICQKFEIPFELSRAEMPELTNADILQVKKVRASKVEAHEPDLFPIEQRADFDLVELTLSEEDARAEAARCLQCSTFCDKCVEVCPNRANYTYLVEPVRWVLPVLACRDSDLVVTGQEVFEVRQARQILHVDDFCNECGNCATFCVHQGKPYTEKPRLFLDKVDFQQETDNAFYIEGNTILRRQGGQGTELSGQDGVLTFENEQVHLTLSVDWATEAWEIGEWALKKRFEEEFSLRGAAEMLLILKGATASLDFLAVTR